jgi:hypothetical protein
MVFFAKHTESGAVYGCHGSKNKLPVNIDVSYFHAESSLHKYVETFLTV